MKRGYPADWDSRRRRVYKRDGFVCQNCARRGGPRGNLELHAHHVVPKSRGGTHEVRNLITVCKDCHEAIHGRGLAPVPIDRGDFSDRVKRAIERHYRSDKHADGYVRLGKSSGSNGLVQRRVDRGRNAYYGGCPRCCESALTVSWVGLRPGRKVKVVECGVCGAQFDEQLMSRDGRTVRVLSAIDDPTDGRPVRSAIVREVIDQVRLALNL